MAIRNRRKLYTGGALMVLAPIGAAGCSGSTTEGNESPAQGKDGSADVAADQDAAPTEAAPEVMAVVPYDAMPEAVMVAPADGPIAIAPPDDAGYDGPLLIAPPPDAKKEAGQGETCAVNEDCINTLFCETIPCIVACDPMCEPRMCDPQNPQCPAGSTCELVGPDNQCVRK